MTNHDLASLSQTIDTAFDNRDSITTSTRGEVRNAVEAALNLLDGGKVRVAERGADGNWTVAEAPPAPDDPYREYYFFGCKAPAPVLGDRPLGLC